MPRRNNNAWLKRLMKARGLTRPDIAEHCEVSLSTVDRWLVPPRKPSHRKMPNMAVALLQCLADLGRLPDEKN